MKANNLYGFPMLAGVAALALAAGCGGPVENDYETVALGGATSLDAHFDVEFGELDIRGGADELMEANFTDQDRDSPRIDYYVDRGIGRLSVTQLTDATDFMMEGNRWDVDLNNDVPMALRIDLDYGDASLDIGDMTLTSFAVDVNHGDATVDLVGEPDRDLDGVITMENGHIRLRIPAQVSARIVVDHDHGDLEATGFWRNGNTYHADGAPDNDVDFHIEIDLDHGEIDLERVY